MLNLTHGGVEFRRGAAIIGHRAGGVRHAAEFLADDWATELELWRQSMRLTRGGRSMERLKGAATSAEIEAGDAELGDLLEISSVHEWWR